MPKISEETFNERRSHILAAARRCFARSGISISVDEVCETAGVSKGAFYGYFKSKDALFEALAREHGAMLRRLPLPTDRAGLVSMLLERASVPEPHFARMELDTMAYASRHAGLHAIFVDNAQLLRQAIKSALAGFALDGRVDVDAAAGVLEAATMAAFLGVALSGEAAVEDGRRRIVEAVDLILVA